MRIISSFCKKLLKWNLCTLSSCYFQFRSVSNVMYCILNQKYTWQIICNHFKSCSCTVRIHWFPCVKGFLRFSTVWYNMCHKWSNKHVGGLLNICAIRGRGVGVKYSVDMRDLLKRGVYSKLAITISDKIQIQCKRS